MRSFSFFLIFILQLFILQIAKAQGSLANVLTAFSTISTEPQVLQLKRSNINIPSGGHLQGIQALSDSVFVITGSSSSYSYYLTASKTQLTSIKKISDAPYRHAGGCQVNDGQLIVGVEDNQKKDKSIIYSIGLADKGNESSRSKIVRRDGIYERSTAGATGYVKLKDGRYITAVADWDSRNIDFYDSGTKGDSIVSYHAPDSGSWCSYQSINLLTDASGHLYLIGFGLDAANDRADLFEVTFANGKADLKLLSTRNFKCKGTSFRYAAGIGISKEGKLTIYSTSRNVSNITAINIFR